MPLVASPTEAMPKTASAPVQKATPGSSAVLALFLASFFVPFTGQVAGMSLYPLRALILVLFIPFLVSMLIGRAGRWTMVDGLLVLYAIWVCLSLVVHHGMERFPYGAILGIEAFGGYAVARVLIRNSADYRRFFSFYLLTLLLILPFAFKEFSMPGPGALVRWGFARVQMSFPHQIHYGLFCSLAVASSYYLYRNNFYSWMPRIGIAIITTTMSLSSAPLLSMVLQILMIMWAKLTRGNWKLFIILSICLYAFLETFTRRGAIIFLINKLTFSAETGYMRIYIWENGKANVFANPLFGLGLNDWVRPSWMGPSVDNFWLLTAMRHGLPCIIFLLTAFFIHVYFIVRTQNLDFDRKTIRTGYLITLLGLMFILSTVAIWNELLIFVMFYLGAGAFLYTSANEPVTTQELSREERPVERSIRGPLPLTRFPRPIAGATPASRDQRTRPLGDGFRRTLPPEAKRR